MVVLVIDLPPPCDFKRSCIDSCLPLTPFLFWKTQLSGIGGIHASPLTAFFYSKKMRRHERKNWWWWCTIIETIVFYFLLTLYLKFSSFYAGKKRDVSIEGNLKDNQQSIWPWHSDADITFFTAVVVAADYSFSQPQIYFDSF